MTQTDRQLAAVLTRIRQCDPAIRYRYHAELRSVIAQRLRHGERLSPELRNLDCELAAEAAEARFDNMPV